ncbi:MAG: aminotransferase class V-fold PLP-dependent enzyme, partial [Desulfobulbaceae bacterium]|nr:aminotransferase class V-fold PLP-dependent enzyme [Desulfobulbaceae bacterium]
MKKIYFDNNATTPLDPAVREAMLPYLDDRFGNPSSGHRFGEDASEAVAQARSKIAA